MTDDPYKIIEEYAAFQLRRQNETPDSSVEAFRQEREDIMNRGRITDALYVLNRYGDNRIPIEDVLEVRNALSGPRESEEYLPPAAPWAPVAAVGQHDWKAAITDALALAPLEDPLVRAIQAGRTTSRPSHTVGF